MGRESASYFLTVAPEHEEALVVALREGGAQPVQSGHTWIELRLRDPYRYWIDLRVHRAPEPLLEIRIALTNDEWSIRVPLEQAFTALPPAIAARPLRDEDGGELGAPGDEGWSLRLEEDYGRRRAEFVATVGDFTAPISADLVYLHVHQTRWRRDDDEWLATQRHREVSRIERRWEAEPEAPPDDPDQG
jgi:hypothetical protein